MDSAIQSSATTIDHVGLVAKDVADLRAAYARLGFTVSAAAPVMQPGPDGTGEVPLGLLAAHIAFESTAIELIAVRHPGQGSHLDKWLAKREGLHVMGLRTDDIVRSYREMTSAGLILPPIRTALRKISGNGVKAIARSRSYELPESIAREGSAYIMHHDTPDIMYDPRRTTHANGALGLRSVFAVVENMDEAFGRYQRLPGTKRRSFAVGRTILLNQQQFVVVERGGFSAMFPGLDIPPAPHLGGYAVAVADIAATRALFAKTGIYFKNWGDKGIWVPPEDTGGAVLAFVDQSSPV
jgi:catechol 2,3-dioxygenase-like lactoylglutathione lyase family enzyme